MPDARVALTEHNPLVAKLAAEGNWMRFGEEL